MQSFGDNTLLACLNVEGRHGMLQEGDEAIPREENDSDLGGYFKQSLRLSEFTNEVNVDATKAKLSNSTNKGDTVQRDLSDLGKYFEDSIIFPRSKNLSSNALREEQRAAWQRNRSGASRCVDTIASWAKQSSKTINVVKGRDELDARRPCKNECRDNAVQNAAAVNSDTISLGIDATQDQESIVIASPPISTQDRCKLTLWGLPPNILQKYTTRGVEYMFPWQMECLSNQKVIQEKRNLMYSAPTSAGKTFVAEILLIKTVLEMHKKVIFILPFVSVVREKMYYFQDLLSNSGIRVEGFMGGVVPPGGFAATNVAVATIEKANSLVNRLMEENDLSSLGAVIIDELHLLGDANRGYLLELLLTKLKYMTIRNDDINIQLIGMSATLPNLPTLAEWLDAELYKTEFRPIPLNEYCKIGATIYDNKLSFVRKLTTLPELEIGDVDNILQLCIETIGASHSVLIFCPTKKWCEKLAEQIATAFFKLGSKNTTTGIMLKKEINSDLIHETLEQLKRSPSGLDNILKSTISFGIAFHHAGLTMDERDIIEGSFRTGCLRVLIATSTLSSGVNLPARRVIIRSPFFGPNLLNSLAYKQMIGRAGRMGRDNAGESILICKPTERNAAASLLSATLDPIESCLNDSMLLIRALLEAVASEVLYTLEDLELYTNCTLLSFSDQSNVKTLSSEAIKFLLDNEFLLLQTTERETRWVATSLGKACLAASVPPREGLFLFEELQKARKCFVLDTELHVIYLVTPLTSGSQIGTVDWMTFHELWNEMSESERRVGNLVGVEERFLMSAIRGVVKPGKSLNIHKRFYSALALHDLVNEVPLNAVCKKYRCCRGVLQTLQQSAATYAGMVTQFCKQLRWDCMELLISQFQTRLQFGVCRELVDLLRLPMLNGLRARSLYKQGLTCVAELAVANELNVERALYNALPFESEKEQEGEYALEAEKRNKMRTVFVTGRDGLTPHQAAILLVQEARMLVQKELGLEQLPWEQNERSLRVNTCIDIKNTSNTEEQSQIELNLEISESTKINLSAAKNFVHDNENQKNDHSNIYTCKKTENKNGSAKTKKTKKSVSDDQQLNQIIASSIHLENDKDSSNSPDLSTSDIMSDEYLNNSKENKNYPQTGNSVKIKRNKDLKKCSPNNNNVPNKKLKVSSLDEMKNTNKDLIEPILDEDIKSSYSRSPSLFDESLNLDTQMCNILEQNIDTSHLTKLQESKEVANKLNVVHMSPKRSIDSNRDNMKICGENNIANERVSTNVAHLSSKHSVLLWDDDSWNDSELLKKVVQDNALDQNIEKEISKHMIKNIVNTSPSIFMPRNTKTCMQDKKNLRNVKKPTDTMVKEKASQKSKLLKVATVQSSVTNVIGFKNERKKSIGSNKSDPDDIVVETQHFQSPFSNNKSRTRAQLEQLRKIRSQKLSEDKIGDTSDDINSSVEEIPNDVAEDRAKWKAKSKVIKSTSRIKQRDTQTSVSCKSTESKTETLSRSEDEKNLDQTIDWNILNIVKVANSRATFSLFKRELLKKRSISLALHCDLYIDNTNSIGSKICVTSTEVKRRTKKPSSYTYENREIRGAAISWESNIAYYISFNNSQESKISGKEQMALLKELLSDTTLYVRCFAMKDTYKLLYQCCGISAKCRFLDPVIAHWLFTNGAERKFNEMVTKYFPKGNFIMSRTNSYYNAGPGIDVRSSLSGEFRSAAETVLTWHMTDNIINQLEELDPVLLHTFREMETRIVTVLACMELSGIGMNMKSLQDLSSVLSNEIQRLETKAYELAGRKFNFSSSKEVGQVLGLYKDKKVSTNKAVLEKCDNPISRLIISWRKLSSTKTKIIYPLSNLVQKNSRIHGNCITCTVTGRVSMHEPNLQNVPKDFSINDNVIVSVRTAFVPALGNIMLSADYCQLELRLLTHFSQDSILCQIMKQQGDIFKSIAAKWNNVTEKEVTNEMRQHTKQLCYGMIYGMGVKSLAENLCISESEAQEFLESFMSTYPGIYKWLNDVLEKAHHDGYVTTILGRRRPLPDLKSTKSSIRAQAERQAVNTKVQGSAADIVKKAMISIEDRIRHSFPDSAVVFPEAHTTRKLRSSRDLLQRGGYLVLQIHDELLYEINLADLKEVAAIIKDSMENICQLTIPLPVKVRVGPTWGNLTEYQI